MYTKTCGHMYLLLVLANIKFYAAVVYLHTIKGLAHNILSSHAIFLTSNGKAKVCTN